MIPFARVVKYGNVVEKPVGIQKAMATSTGTFVLKDNTLYYYGRNQYGEAAQGDTLAKTSWVVVSTNVDDFYAYDVGVVLHRTDGSIWSSGRCVWFNTSTISNVLINRDTWFSSVPWDNIRNMTFTTSGTLFVVTKDNKLYAATGNGGRGVLGNGTVVSVYQLTFLLDNVQSAIAALNDSAYLSTDGKLYSTGWNDQGIHGNGNRTQINTWKLQDSGVTHYALSNNVFIYKNATSFRTVGNSPLFSRSTGNVYSWETVPTSVLDVNASLYFLLIPLAGTTQSSQIVLSSTQQLAVGSNSINMGIGRSGTVTTPANIVLPISVGDIKIMTINTANSAIVSNDGELYCTGTAGAFPAPTSANYYDYIKVVGP